MSDVGDKAILARLIGYLDADMDPPTFIVPVFRDLDDDAVLLQIPSTDFRIESFEQLPINCSFKKFDGSTRALRKIGDEALYGFITTDGEKIVSERAAFETLLQQLLGSGAFESVPAFGLSVAKILKDTFQGERLLHRIFDELPDNTVKSKKYFLENDVVREALYKRIPVDRHHIVSRTSISIIGNKINVTLPLSAAESDKRELGQQVATIFRDFTKSNSVDLSFEEPTFELERLNLDAINIRSGRFRYNTDIFDMSGCAKKINFRESVAIVPQAAITYYNTPLSKTASANALVSHNLPKNFVSETTARKIVECTPVSVISAILFRLWLFANTKSALSSDSFKIHICCWRPKSEFWQNFLMSERGSDFFNIKYVRSGRPVLPMSMVLFLVKSGAMSNDEALENFEFSRSGHFKPWMIDWKARSSWINFCDYDHKIEKSALALQLLERNKGIYY